MVSEKLDRDHEELLRLARRAEAAARAGDRAQLASSTNQLLSRLAAHLDDERIERLRLGPEESDAMARSQQRVAERFLALTREAMTNERGTCDCARVAAEARALLRRQVESEGPSHHHA